MALLLGHRNSLSRDKLRLAREGVEMGGVAPLTLLNAVLSSIHTQEGLEVQLLRNESKCCIMTPGQGRVTADSWGLGHCPAGDCQAKTSTRDS